jgi:hypothetical protein
LELIEGQGSPIFCITRHLDAGYFGEKWSTWLGSADFVFSETVQPGTFGSDIYICVCVYSPPNKGILKLSDALRFRMGSIFLDLKH